ncbi:alpha-E domain-containing protein [Aurantivibrio infirmus]
MLSRVAERVYWLGRYMERVENTARLINVNSNLLLDLPRGSQIGWSSLVDITGASEEFAEKESKGDEISIIRFLIADLNNPVSIISSLKAARENARTTREIIPSESWELINNLYFFAKENASKSVSRAARSQFLIHIIHQAQQLTGGLAGTMSHTNAYEFIRLGRNLERADMTTRIVDVGTVNLITNLGNKNSQADSLEPFINILWMSVLQSLSAYQMYRQNVLDRVNGEDVVDFLLKNPKFPRAVASCFKQLLNCLKQLPNADEALRTVASAQRHIDAANIEEMLEEETLHDYIDDVQLNISNIHNEIAAAWFLPSVTPSSASSA